MPIQTRPPLCALRAAGWLNQHGDALYRYAMLRLGEGAAAEDAVQETLLAAMASWDTFRGDSSELTWLTGILRHKVLDQLRARTRSDRWTISLHAVLGEQDGHFGPRHGWVERPAEVGRLEHGGAAEREELRAALWRAIAALPDTMREVFCLRELDEMPTTTICELMSLTPTNVWTLVHRAKLRLRDALAEHAEADRS